VIDSDFSSSPKPIHIGVFDSGVGGLSVLRALRRKLPQARLTYLADSAHAPYGERDAAFVADRSRVLTQALVERGAQMIVIACNTATALAIDALRLEMPHLPFVGVEPGIKPALAATRTARVGVMATSATLASERFRRLLQAQTAARPDVTVSLQACPGLARALERGPEGDAEVAELVGRYAKPLRDGGADVVVLGCTHYPFAMAQIAAALGPGVNLLDTSQAVAQQAARLARDIAPDDSPARHDTTLLTTGDPAQLEAVARAWLDFAFDAPPSRVDI
jgi:glutamate racemase